MGGYTKNIAVIRGLRDGFSADGGALSGLIRAEKYGQSLRVEVSLINFAPLTEGRYVAALTDGAAAVLIEDCLFEGTSEVDTSQGFAAGIFYVNGGVFPVASAICGNFHGAALDLKGYVERAEGIVREKAKTDQSAATYEDEAIAEVNYYEYAETDQDGRTVCADPKKEKDGDQAEIDETAACAVEEKPGGVAGKDAEEDAEERRSSVPPLARGCFYEKMKGEIEGILSAYPPEEALCRTVENSRWVRISYGDDTYYVFGVIYADAVPQYICYGVPAKSADRPPESMAGLAGYVPSSPQGNCGGYWVMYQDANTGASLKLDFE